MTSLARKIRNSPESTSTSTTTRTNRLVASASRRVAPDICIPNDKENGWFLDPGIKNGPTRSEASQTDLSPPPQRISTVSYSHSSTSPIMAPERPQPRSKLQEFFPNTKPPIIISAPMLGVSNGTLAAHVSKAGGFGMVPGGLDFKPGSAQLAALENELKAARSVLGLTEMTLTPAPVGVGFLTFDPSAAQFRETVLPILEKYLPQAVWLFAPDPKTAERAHPGIIEACHDHGIKVFVQVGTVAAAREAARDGADVIVAQGVDAGGHQFAAGAGVVSLVPEIRAMLDDDFMGKHIALVAAGGIADPSAVVAAIALGECATISKLVLAAGREANGKIGADGVVMGTKVSLGHP